MITKVAEVTKGVADIASVGVVTAVWLDYLQVGAAIVASLLTAAWMGIRIYYMIKDRPPSKGPEE